MSDPVFDITLGQSPRDSSVKVNGQDITPHLRGVTVQLAAGGLTHLTLQVAHCRHLTRVVSAIGVDQLAVTCAHCDKYHTTEEVTE